RHGARGAGRRHRGPGAGHPVEHGRAARTDPVRGRGGRRARLSGRRVHRVPPDRAGADLRSRARRLARGSLRRDRTHARRRLVSVRHLARHRRADRADHSLCAAGSHADLPAPRPARDARHMRDAAKPAAWTAAPAAAMPGAARRYGAWIATAAVFVVLPHVFSSGTALTLMSLMGIAIIFALSYNMLLGQTGMLSFGHAVYYGLGAFCAVHVMNAAIREDVPVPLILIPLIGGLRGLLFCVIFRSEEHTSELQS